MLLSFTRRDEVGKRVMKHSRTQNRLGMLFFKLHKLAPVGAPLLTLILPTWRIWWAPNNASGDRWDL